MVVVVVTLLMLLVPSEISAKIVSFFFVSVLVQIVEPHKSTAMLVILISTVVKSLCVLAFVKRGKPTAEKSLSSYNSNNSKERNSNKDV